MEYLFTEENLKMILAPWERPGKKRGKCPICAGLPSTGKNDAPGQNSEGLSPVEESRLEEFIIVKNSWNIFKCPLCARLYTDEYRYDSLAGGHEDDYHIAGIEYREALELLKSVKAKRLTKAGSTWIVSF
jgi:hypothetical protein